MLWDLNAAFCETNEVLEPAASCTVEASELLASKCTDSELETEECASPCAVDNVWSDAILPMTWPLTDVPCNNVPAASWPRDTAVEVIFIA